MSIDKPTIQNNWDDVVYVTAMVTDENGNDILTADNKIKFSIEGAGVIAAVDNGDIASTEPYQATERWAYKGRCIAVIKAKADSGIIKLTAKADGLKEASVTVTVVK